ncbi:MAG: HAD family phosphatase [Oliverpabstia sp.]|nr:HAD family phosphatase [Oliverpabstia sp.]
MIKNIIFDVGKVLVEYDPDGMMKKLGFDEETLQTVNQAVFQNELWNESDRGVLSPEELLEAFIANNPAYEKEIRQVIDAVGDTISLMPYAVEWVKGLKERGYHLYILSNYAEYTYEKTSHKMEFLPYMDGVVFSYRCKLIKPEKEIYEYICKTYELKPEESVFLDDRKDNVEAARNMGMHGIVFENYAQGSETLEQLLKN